MDSSGYGSPLRAASMVTCPSLNSTLPTPETAYLNDSIIDNYSSIYDHGTGYHEFTAGYPYQAVVDNANLRQPGQNELHMSASNGVPNHTGALLHNVPITSSSLPISNASASRTIYAQQHHKPVCPEIGKATSWSMLTEFIYPGSNPAINNSEQATPMFSETLPVLTDQSPSSLVLSDASVDGLGRVTPGGATMQTCRLLQYDHPRKHGVSSLPDEDLYTLFPEYRACALGEGDPDECAVIPQDVYAIADNHLTLYQPYPYDNGDNSTFQDYNPTQYHKQAHYTDRPSSFSDTNHGCAHESHCTEGYESQGEWVPMSQSPSNMGNDAGFSNGTVASQRVLETPLNSDEARFRSMPYQYRGDRYLTSGSPVLPEDYLGGYQSVENNMTQIVPANSRLEEKIAVNKKRKMDFILSCREQNMSYKEIKDLGEFREAESTLRGMVRNTMKAKEARPRKPVWKSRDVTILKETVFQFLHKTTGLHALRFPDLASNSTKAIEKALHKVPWKHIAQSMAKQGCHLYGNATVKKKYFEVMGFSLGKKEPPKVRATSTTNRSHD